MAKCQMCGAEVKIGQYCEYCGSMAEPYNYPMHLRIKEKIIPAKKISYKNDRGHSHEQVYVVERGGLSLEYSKKILWERKRIRKNSQRKPGNYKS